MPSQNKKINIKRLILCALFATMGIVLAYVEFILPINLGVPGIKLGLPNLIILIVLYEMSPKDALAVALIRIGGSALLFKGLFGGIYSLSGGLFSLFIMWLLKEKTDKFSIIGVSMAGGVAHNLAQLIVAVIIMEDVKLFIYFPVILISGLICGIIMGFATYCFVKKIPKRIFI